MAALHDSISSITPRVSHLTGAFLNLESIICVPSEIRTHTFSVLSAMPLPIGLPGHNKIKNMNFQPFRKDKGPHTIYLFRLNATSVDGEATILPFSV